MTRVAETGEAIAALMSVPPASDAVTLSLIDLVSERLPGIPLIGAYSNAGIAGGRVESESAVVTIITSPTARATAKLLNTRDFKDNFALGRLLGKSISEPDSKAFVLLSAGLRNNNDQIVQGITSASPNIPICGGQAATNASSVWLNQDMSRDGFVCLALHGEKLAVKSYNSLGVRSFGPEMTVTAVDGQKVFELDNRPVIDVYRQYLGDDMLTRIAQVSKSFPLVLERDGMEIAREAQTVLPDGSIVFSAPLFKGEVVRFSFAHTELIETEAAIMAQRISLFPTEAILTFSAGTRHLSNRSLEVELGSMAHVAQIGGMLTQSEYFTGPDGNQLLSQTMSVTLFSENPDHKPQRPKLPMYSRPQLKDRRLFTHERFIKALHRLVSQTMSALDHRIEEVERENALNSVVIGHLSGGIMLIGKDGLIIQESARNMEMHGWPRPKLVNQDFAQKLLHPGDQGLFLTTLETIYRKPDSTGSLDVRLRHREGDWRVMALRIRNCLDNPRIGALVMSFDDKTRMTLLENELRHLSPTREGSRALRDEPFQQLANREFQRALKHQRPLSMIVIDLDDLTELVGRFGYEARDHVHETIVDCCLEMAGEFDAVTCPRDNEYLILMPETDLAQALETAEAIRLQIMSIPFQVAGSGFSVTASIGASSREDADESLLNMTRRAEVALYTAKRSGKNRVTA